MCVCVCVFHRWRIPCSPFENAPHCEKEESVDVGRRYTLVAGSISSGSLVESLPAEAVTYKAVGRMFMRTPVPEIKDAIGVRYVSVDSLFSAFARWQPKFNLVFVGYYGQRG